MLPGILKQNKSSLLLLLVVVVLPISASSLSFIFLSTYESTILTFSFEQWTLFYLATAITMAFALTPTTYIALVSGYFIGWVSLFGLVPSYIAASLIGFYIAEKLDKGNFLTYFSDNSKINGIIKNLKTEDFWVIFFCRISPALPFAMMNVFLSLMKVKKSNFISGSVFGMLPRTILSVWVGIQASDLIKVLKGKEDPNNTKLLLITLLALSIVGLYVIFMRALNKYNKTLVSKQE
jgi:uncharacterized membrane protein YdjX (TVP38/TMEM64 family)